MALFQQGSFIFDANTSSPQELARKRAIVAQLMGQRSAPRNVGEGLVAIGDGIVANVLNRRANETEQAGMAQARGVRDQLIATLTGGGFPPAPVNPGETTSMATMPAPDIASARVAQAHGDGDLRSGIEATASALGVDPVDLATAISYETAGTFDPTKRGPRTQWGQHRGLIQFGEPQAKKYGVDWNNPIGSQLGPDGAVAKYLRDTGVQPGMGLLDIYSAINAGGVGRYNRSDANNGGAPGTVRDKVEQQMAGHRAKAAAMFGSGGIPPAVAANEAMATGGLSSGLTPEALQQWGASNYADPAAMQADMGGGVPVAETEADILAQEAAMMGQDPMAFQQPGAVPPMPPARMVDDMPVAGTPPASPISARNINPDMPMAGAVGNRTPPPGPSLQQLLRVVSTPFMDEGTKAYANALLQQQLQAQDPYRQAQIAQLQAQTERLQRQAQGGDTRFGLNPIYGQDAEGNTVLGVLGDDGSFKPVDTGGVNISTGVDRVDLGTHYGLLDKRSGQMVGTLPKENYQEAFDTARGGAEGKAQGEAAVNLPTDLATSEQALSELDALIAHPGLSAIAGPFDQYRPSWMMGAEGRDALARFNQAKGRAFLQAFGMLKGGGQITEIEGLKAEQAMARMDRAQGEEEFKRALQDFRDAVATGMDKMRQRAGQQPASGSDWQDVGGVRIRRKQ